MEEIRDTLKVRIHRYSAMTLCRLSANTYGERAIMHVREVCVVMC